jgi:cyclic-di-AMP phosphodiesterase PgpH
MAGSLLFPAVPGPEMGRYQAGMVATEDVIASLTFGVPKNEEDLERERTAAAASVPPTFALRPEAVAEMEIALEDFFGFVGQAAGSDEPDEALLRVLSDLGLVLSSGQRQTLTRPESRELIQRAALRAVREILPLGVLDDAIREELLAGGRLQIVEPDGAERYAAREEVLTTQDFHRQARALLPATTNADVEEVLRLILIRFMNPTLRFDVEATERDRETSRRAVNPNRATVLQGEAVVRANQQIGEPELARLGAYEEALRGVGALEDPGFQAGAFVGSVILNLLILLVYGTLLYLFRPDVYHNFRWVLLQAVLIIAFLGSAGVISANALPPEVLPIAFVSLAVAVLWDGRLALLLAATLTILVGIQVPFQAVHAWLPVFVGGSAAALSVRAVRRRAQTWIFIAIIASAYLLVIGMLGLVTGRAIGTVASAWVWAGGNAVVSGILAMGFLPVFEWFTRITTDQTLLEWADPNRPLLKRLSIEAPGTYAHTINVANLSEAAANAIGANGLLCRVGVYYHDVGKMVKPQYFIENQPGGRNPHDKLKPTTSAAIVREHVTEGIRLAREANLPDVLIDFIPEHHGTQEISFFRVRAEEEAAAEDREVDGDAFRYPGPKPRSRETAIVMLADAVESATRALQDPSPDRIRELIHGLVQARIESGQLEEAPLTLKDIAVIKEQFEKVLAGAYHHRIDYPSTRHLTESAKDVVTEDALDDTDLVERIADAGSDPAADPSTAGR